MDNIEQTTSAGPASLYSPWKRTPTLGQLLIISGTLSTAYFGYQLLCGRAFSSLNQLQQALFIGSPLVAATSGIALLYFANKSPKDDKEIKDEVPPPNQGIAVKPKLPEINKALFADLKRLSSSEKEERYSFEGRELVIKLGDITKEEVDVVVNAANRALRGGDGVDKAIHKAAGTTLLDELKWTCMKPCEAGNAAITSSHALKTHKVEKIIHAVGPMGIDAKKLASAYTESLKLAAGEQSAYTEMLSKTTAEKRADYIKNWLKLSEEEQKKRETQFKDETGKPLGSIAFPAISTGIFGYEIELATPVAIEAVCQYLHDNPEKIKEVRFLFHDKGGEKNYKIYKQHFERILQAINE